VVNLQSTLCMIPVGWWNWDRQIQFRTASVCRNDRFAEKRFEFLVEWDTVLQTNVRGWLPLHVAAVQTSIRWFTIVFGYVIRYYLYKKGSSLFFPKDNAGDTPLQHVCQKYGRTKVMNVVEETLLLSSSSPHSDNNTQPPPPPSPPPPPQLNIVEAFITAAIDEKIHLDCLYFFVAKTTRYANETIIIVATTTGTTPTIITTHNYENEREKNWMGSQH